MFIQIDKPVLGFCFYMELNAFIPQPIGKIICKLKKNHSFEYSDSCDRNCGFYYDYEKDREVNDGVFRNN